MGAGVRGLQPPVWWSHSEKHPEKLWGLSKLVAPLRQTWELVLWALGGQGSGAHWLLGG